MKELTIEEKAKAYDEALKVAKGLYAKGAPDSLHLERMFPVLKESEESEDEKIRKALIKFHKSTIDVDGIKGEDIIAWLEKQGGQKSTDTCDSSTINGKEFPASEKRDFGYFSESGDKIEPKFKVGDIIKSKKNGDTVKVKHVLSDSYYFSDWDGAVTIHSIADQDNWELVEQKPTDKVEPKFKVGDIVKRKDNPHLTYILKRFTDDGDYEFHAIGKDGNEGCTCFAAVKYQDEWELVEQKPADKKGMNLVEEEMTPFQKEVFCIIDTTIEEEQGLKQVCDELLRLAHNEIEQKSSWSEKDEDNMMMIEDRLSDYLDYIREDTSLTKLNKNSMKEEIIDYVNWLKSLKERYTWKPSEKQMMAINTAINVVGKGTINGKYLIELQEQLKKLMEK